MAWPLPEGAVLGVFAERPDVSRSAGRLFGTMGDPLAVVAAEALTLDGIETWASPRILAPGGRRVIVFTPEDAGPWFDTRVSPAFALQPQEEGPLGRRIAAFLEGELAEGASRVVVIGSDCPTLDPSLVISAFLCLEGRDVVLGPAADGGLYLVGCRATVPPIFEGIDWEESGLLRLVVDRLETAGRIPAVLPPWYRVRSPETWAVLMSHLRALRLSGTEIELPRLFGLCR